MHSKDRGKLCTVSVDKLLSAAMRARAFDSVNNHQKNKPKHKPEFFNSTHSLKVQSHVVSFLSISRSGFDVSVCFVSLRVHTHTHLRFYAQKYR